MLKFNIKPFLERHCSQASFRTNDKPEVLFPDEIRNLFFIPLPEKIFDNRFTKELCDIISDKAVQCSQAVVQRQMILFYKFLR